MRTALLVALLLVLATPAPADIWQMKQRDMWHTGRANFLVLEDNTIFDNILWEQPAPSPGHLRASSMAFYDGAYDGQDIVVGTYGWPKGAIGMDRHTGATFWFGNPGGGETISNVHPAFSNDGSVVYAMNDATAGPAKAWYTTGTPLANWDNSLDPVPGHMSQPSPVVGPDDVVYAHNWCGGIFGVQDNPGVALSEVFASATNTSNCYTTATLYQDGGTLKVIASGRAAWIKCWDAATGAELWATATGAPGGTDGEVTVDPNNGNIYAPAGWNDIAVVGLDKNGNPLWDTKSKLLYDWIDGTNNPQRAQSTGCLSHDGETYYFQTVSQQGDGSLYAVNTADGSLKWSYNTGSEGWEQHSSCPIVTENGVIIVGTNKSNKFVAVKDGGLGNPILLDTLLVNPDNNGDSKAYASASIASDGKMYVPARLNWTASNGDGDTPDGNLHNLFMCFQTEVIPEPSIMVLFGLGLLSLLGLRRRK